MSLDNLKVGDVLYSKKHNEERTVLFIGGSIYFLSCNERPHSYAGGYTIHDIKSKEFKLKQPEIEPLKLEVGKYGLTREGGRVKIVHISAHLKDYKVVTIDKKGFISILTIDGSLINGVMSDRDMITLHPDQTDDF